MAFADDLYEKLTSQEDSRLCRDISDAACRDTPRNFSLILVSHVLTKLGDAIASPKTTLAWMTGFVGAPAFVLGFLVPIRESGSLIPQLFIGGVVRRLAVRKWVWVIGSLGQSVAIGGLAAVVFLLTGAAAGWAILGLLILFSLSRGLSSVAAKDVTGKTIPKTKRGQLTGWSASAAGLISMVVGLTLILPASQTAGVGFYAAMLAAAAALWLIAAAVFSRVQEYRGETGGARNVLESLRRLRLLASDKPFRRFVLTRALLMCSALSAPFYIALAQDKLGSPAYLLGLFVAASGLASLLSAPFWGRFADRSSKWVMVAAACVTSTIGLITFALDQLAPSVTATAWFLPAAYFFLSIAHAGVRVGRKTYVVDLATGNQRTDYVAISNTVIGVLLLLVGSVGALTPLLSVGGVIALLAAMGVAGALLGTTLRDV